MKLHQSTAEIFIPDGTPIEKALARTTHLAVGAHQDDLEIMAAEPIMKCFQKPDLWFTGVTATDGRGSPRDGHYQSYTDEEMRLVRFNEQKKAGGKRYDLATMGRHKSHSTYFVTHGTDTMTGLSLGMDMTVLVNELEIDPAVFVRRFIERFAQDIDDRLKRLRQVQ